MTYRHLHNLSSNPQPGSDMLGLDDIDIASSHADLNIAPGELEQQHAEKIAPEIVGEVREKLRSLSAGGHDLPLTIPQQID